MGLATAALGATVNGTVTNASGQTGRIFLRVFWNNGGPCNWGKSIPSAGAYSIRGVGDGSFVITGFVDKNGDGIPNVSEASGMSGVVNVSGSSVSGLPDLILNAPASANPVAVSTLRTMPFDGGVLLMWDHPRNQYGFVQADSYRVEWSTNNFSTILGYKDISPGNGEADGIFVATPLTNNTNHSFRIKSIIGAATVISSVASAAPAVPVGGHSISGTINLPAGVSVPAATPIIPLVEGVGGIVFMKPVPSFVNGTAFSVGGIPDGYYHLHALVDMNKDNRPSIGDYWADPVQVTINGANVAGRTLIVRNPNAKAAIETGHDFNDSLSPSESYSVAGRVEGGVKRPVNIYMNGAAFSEGVDLAWDYSKAEYWQWTGTRPQTSDDYSFVVAYPDNTTETLHASPSVVYDTPVPNNVTPAGTIAASSLTGTYTPLAISWAGNESPPAGWVAEVEISGLDSNYWWNTDVLPISGTTSTPYDGPGLNPGVYYVHVQFCEDWGWNCVSRTQNLNIVVGTCATPANITIPAADADGAYTVSWGASATPGVAYQLQEATNNTFTAGLRTIAAGTALSANITGRSQNVTYFYRVRATKPNYTDSSYRTAGFGCAVPGTANAGAPASIAVPVADADGAYTVSWGATATTGATYELQEATNSLFTAGLRTAYQGLALSASITGRSQNVTYYYRVRAVKAGMKESGYRAGVSGCAVPGTLTVGPPASITVPVADADGSYSILWGTSATAGATYELQEATASNFSTGLRTAYRGTATSVSIAGRSQNVTYYYRVRAVKAGLKDSGYRAAAGSCAVPGTTTAGMPASIAIPASDPDGAYPISWGASATAGATYELQEATNNTFTTGLRLAYRGTALSTGITGRVAGTTYYYRVRAVKGGLRDSSYRTMANGCVVGL
jgi:hypothetical protein